MAAPPNHVAASKLAQLLADVIVQHAPHTAKVNTDETRRQVDEWLDGLEAHGAKLAGPFLQKILDESNPPAAVKGLITEAMQPQAAFSAGLVSIFTYSIVSSLIGAAAQPFLQGISNDLWAAAVNAKAGLDRPVDPAVLATAAGRGFTYPQPSTVAFDPKLYLESRKSGISDSNLDLLASLVGLPPALQELFEMLRRGIITAAGSPAPGVETGGTVALDTQGQPLTVEKGLQEGDFRDDWIAAAVQLAHAFLTPLDFVRAAVQEQMSYHDARAWAHATGLDWNATVPVNTIPGVSTPDMFGLAFSIAGRPPGPQELGRMALRGIVPWAGSGADQTTFQQGIAESDVKTKWTDALQALSTYVPPSEQVGTLYEHGGLTDVQAMAYWAENGVPPDLAAAYLYVAQQQHITQDKLEAKRDVIAAYYDGIIDHPTAVGLLGQLGYRGATADQMLAIVDFRRELTAINKVVSKIGTLYTEFKISAANALATLAAVGLSLPQQQALLGIWDLLRIAPVRVPTVSEIGLAVKHQTITEAEGLTELETLGYQPRDAAIVLSAHATMQVVPLPPPGSGVIG